jgi:hypothetical protein
MVIIVPKLYAILNVPEKTTSSSLFTWFQSKQTEETVSGYFLSQVDFFSHLKEAQKTCEENVMHKAAVIEMEVKNDQIISFDFLYKMKDDPKVGFTHKETKTVKKEEDFEALSPMGVNTASLSEEEEDVLLACDFLCEWGRGKPIRVSDMSKNALVEINRLWDASKYQIVLGVT